MLDQLHNDIKKSADPKRAKASAWFFKTGEGQYGHGDQFVGLTVPHQRVIAKRYKDLPLEDIKKLLESKIHEERLIALLILVLQFQRATGNPLTQRATEGHRDRQVIFDFYLANTMYINNWDLVDSSAYQIVGEHLLTLSSPTRLPHVALAKGGSGILNPKDFQLHASSRSDGSGNDNIEVLLKLAKSDLVWERRIAIIATAAFIKHGRCDVTFEIADILLHDTHDLIQKAVGWMLREAGKRCGQNVLADFLKSRYKTMPRTMLRYAIEHFSQDERQAYLKRET